MRVSYYRVDWVMLFAVLALAGGSLFHLYTITFPGEAYYFFRQTVWMGIGLGLLFAVFFFKTNFWKKIAYPVYGIVLLALIVVLFKGASIHGAHRWFRIGTITFQPSEFAKLALILVLGRLLANKAKIGWKEVGISLGFTFPFLILVAVQPDLGGAFIFLLLWIGMLFLTEISLKRFLYILGMIFLLLSLSYFLFRPYQKMRILAFLNPESDPLGTGWSILQSKVTLGSGGLIGKGIWGAVHTQLKFLSQPFTDFIFASVGEEWGFVGVLIVLGLYGIIITKGLVISKENRDNFAGLISAGITILFFLHVFINVGMTVGIMPVTGIPLPLMSYGGSSTIMFLLGMGILFSLKRGDQG
ncbi:MAG: rod shape-determining protein RodA [Candidatus Aerophobetes bacterium]|nr:rod shape-determining protein RodA [Candidatus Aerophobetes bacterium]